MHNRTNSALYRLPPELQFLVADFLSPTSHISLRLTGRHFYHLLPNPVDIDPIEARKFEILKFNDNYNWNLRREAAFGIDNVDKITCNKCKILHEKNMFSPQQIKGIKEGRVCKGGENVLWICQHLSFSYDEVVALWDKKFPVMGEEIIDFRICAHPSHLYGALEISHSAPFLGGSINSSGYFDRLCVVTRSWRIASVRSHEMPTEEMLESGLARLDDFLCPHVSTTDAIQILPKRTAPAVPSRYPFYISQLDSSPPECRPGACRVCTTLARFCGHKHCDTSWTIFRQHNNPDIALDDIILSLKRQIGPGLGQTMTPHHPSWLAQITPDRLTNRELGKENSYLDAERFFTKFEGKTDPLIVYLRSRGKRWKHDGEANGGRKLTQICTGLSENTHIYLNGILELKGRGDAPLGER